MTTPTIAIFRHAASEGPGTLADFLNAAGQHWRLIAIDAGDALPASAQDFAGLVFMGGPMSVNDDLPWIAPVLALIQEAVAHDIPVLGHCLGGQLMAKALGGCVSRNPIKEIGWGRVEVAHSACAQHWFGPHQQFMAFHWHGETFSVPAQAELILSSPHCAHQAFAWGPHLGLQCHIEMNSSMINQWCELGADEIQAARSGPQPSPAVQTAAAIVANSPTHLPALNQVAEQVYQRWLQGVQARAQKGQT